MDLTVLKKGGTVAAAVSGGIDSMVLLHKLNEVKGEIGFKLVVVNVDHNLRMQSAADSKFVKEYAEKLKLKFFGFSVDVTAFAKQNKMSVETAARALRYQSFETVEADCIALAHHQSDQAESVLMHIVRGSGANGACGMKAVSGKYVRPLLFTSKEEICNYQTKHGIPFVEDETNADSVYARNFLRNEIMPLLKKLNCKAEENIAKFAERLAEDEAYLKSLAAAEFADGETFVPLDAFGKPCSLWKRSVFAALGALGVFQDIEANHLNLIKDLAESGENGAGIDLPFGVRGIRDYSKITFLRESVKERAKIELPFKEGSFVFNGKLITVSEGEGRWKFDLEKVPENAVFRYRQEGDVFTKHGGGTKKFKDFLIDKKISQRKRDNLIVLACGNEVLFAEGVEMSGKLWTDEHTKKIYNVNVSKITKEDER